MDVYDHFRCLFKTSDNFHTTPLVMWNVQEPGTLYCDLKNHGQTGERDLPEGVQHVKDLTAKTQKY